MWAKGAGAGEGPEYMKNNANNPKYEGAVSMKVSPSANTLGFSLSSAKPSEVSTKSSSAFYVAPPPLPASSINIREEMLEMMKEKWYQPAYETLTHEEYASYLKTHEEQYKRIFSILNDVFSKKVEINKPHVERFPIAFIFFPSKQWVIEQNTGMVQKNTNYLFAKEPKIWIPKPIFFTSTIKVEKRISPTTLQETFYISNECITVTYKRNYGEKVGEWTSVLQKERSIPCFDPPLPRQNTLDLLMELRLLLQTMLVTDFSIVDVAEMRDGNKEVILTPFKLLRGETLTTYMKFGFAPSISEKEYFQFIHFLHSRKGSDFSASAQERIQKIYRAKIKPIAYDANESIITILQRIYAYEEIREQPEPKSARRNFFAFHFNIKNATNLSSSIFTEAMALFQTETGINIEYNGTKGSINFLNYIAGKYDPPHLFLVNPPETPPGSPASSNSGRHWGGENWPGGGLRSRSRSRSRKEKGRGKHKRKTKKRPT